MRIKSLKLQNIRSYTEETIEFPEGSVLLAGDIGAGKSTILLAIEYALFGTKRGELEPISLLRNGSHAGRIELDFEINNTCVKISRTLKRTAITIKQEAGYIVINNKRIDATPVELRARVMELLGYPQESQLAKDLIYRYTVFTPQEQMRQIIYENTETRMNTLRKIFNIDKYKHIIENAQFVAKELHTQKQILQETVADVPLIEQQQKDLIEQQKEKEESVAQHFLQLQQIQESAAKIKKQIDTAETEQKKVHDLRQQHALHTQDLQKNKVHQTALLQKKQQIQRQKELLHALQAPLSEPSSEKTRAELEQEKEAEEKNVQELQQTYAVIKEQRKAGEEKQQQIQKTICVLQEALLQKSYIEQQLRDAESLILQRQTCQKNIVECEEQLQRCHQHKAEADMKKNTAQNILQNLSSLDVCTLCLQDIDSEHKERIISDQTYQTQSAEKEIEHIHVQHQLFHEQLDELKKKFNAILTAEQKKASLTIMLQNLAEKEKELQQKQEESIALEQHTKQIPSMDTALLAEKQAHVMQVKLLLQKFTAWEAAVQEQKNRQVLIQDKEMQEKDIEKELLQLTEQCTVLQQKLTALGYELLQFTDIETTLGVYKQELQKIYEHEKQSEIILATVRKEQQHIVQYLETIDAEIQKKKSVQEKIKKIRATAQWLEDYFVALIQTMEKQVFLQVHSSFNHCFTEWFATLVGDAMNARLDEEFTPIVEQNGYDANVMYLSGGEKTAVSLAYRLALNKVVNDFISTIATKDFIILDEPTEGFSSEQLDTVREVLDALGLKQIILVSHESKIESFVEHVIRIEKLGHVSKVVS